MTLDISLSDDRHLCRLAPAPGAELDAAALDALIARLVAARAAMAPAQAATYDPHAPGGYDADNLLWDTAPDPSQRAVALGVHHPGLGWISLRLTRAQIEDLITSYAFSLDTLMRHGGTVPANRPPEPAPEPPASAPVPLRHAATRGAR